MGYLEKLIAFTKENKLITSIEDVGFLFVFSEYDETLSLEQLITLVLTTEYNNDNLEDFYGEHWDAFKELEFATQIQVCSLITQKLYPTSFELYRMESKNKYYYKIESYGIHEDAFDTLGFYEVIDKSGEIKNN